MSNEPTTKKAAKASVVKASPAFPAGVVQVDDLQHVTRTAPHDGLNYPFAPGAHNQEFFFLAVRDGSAGSFMTRDVGVTGRWGNEWGLWSNLGQAYGWRKLHVVALAKGQTAWDCYCLVERFFSSPWGSHPAFVNNLERWVETFPTPSLKVPGLVAYYQDADKRARDIQTPIKPGKYLKKFFADLLTEAEIHEMALAWSNEYAARKLHVSQDADEIERIYRGKYNGSCMHFGGGGYAGSEHPARVYAGPDLGIAYIGDVEAVDGRCLVWPSKKIYYPKFYGDSHRMEAALTAAGWVAGEEEDFDEARVQRIPCGSAFVLPYLDTHDKVRDDGDYLVLDDCASIAAKHTSGLSGTAYRCDECGETARNEAGLTYVDGGDRSLCDCCLEESHFFCDELEEYRPNDESVPVHSDTYAFLSERGAEIGVSRGRLFFCELSDAYYSHRDYEAVELTDGRTAELGRAERDGYFCEHTEMWSVDHDSRQELSDGRYVDADTFVTAGELDRWLEAEGVTLAGAIPDENQIELDLAA